MLLPLSYVNDGAGAPVPQETPDMTRVAILGSCITRDLWPVRGGGEGWPMYISRTSLPSLLSVPIAGFAPPARRPAALGPHQAQAVIADLTKTALARLVAYRPTHLIFDFIDERFDLLSLGEARVTRSWELEASGWRSNRALRNARPIPRLSEGCERLWLEAAGEFAAVMRATPLKDARLILHSARWAQETLTADGVRRPLANVEILAGEPAEIAAHNALLARYETAFLDLTPPVAIVAAPELRLADPEHRWGLSPFHYRPEYYAEIARQLEALGVPPISPPGAGPSVRAA
jgi:hypothetical protein